ncbi:MAG: arginyltransferase [Spirochaetes bacterium]|nr:MAG: arginyltransferase [Spirochaetota bacterium]
MLILRDLERGEETVCAYLPDRLSRMEYFLAIDVSAHELEYLLADGWRKFGYCYFRPHCNGCRLCIPLRVLATKFLPSKGQRRVARKNAGVRVEFGPLSYSDEIYDIYVEHTGMRFGDRNTAHDDFMFNFYQRSCPSFQSEYYVDGRLAAVGFLDRSSEGLSSVYFIYRESCARLSPGIFSVMREIGFARELGLSYYYLGYFVPGCGRMEYKGGFTPHEKFSWGQKKWFTVRGRAVL